MKPKKKSRNRAASISMHLVLSDYCGNNEQNALLKEIVNKFTPLSFSVIGENKVNNNSAKLFAQIGVYEKMEDAKNTLSECNGHDKILLISLNNNGNTIIEAINCKASTHLDIYSHEDDAECRFLLLKNFIFSSIKWGHGKTFEENLNLFLRNNYVEAKKYHVLFKKGEQTFNNLSKALHVKPGSGFGLKLGSLLKTPFSTPNIFYKRNRFIYKESSVFRFLFVACCAVFFVLLPVLSLDAGISGDEEKHVEQSEKIYNYFKTHGEDKSYLKCSYGPFYAYNITFDVFLHSLIKVFNIENIYEFRHVINSIIGFLTILFCGLLVVFLAGWRAGFIAILLLFFSPRFLGHTYNNPKDIPFAMCYVFSMYQIVKFINLLPKISFKHAIGITFGIGAALNVRIGGLLLIAYLFLFTGLFILTHFRFKEIFGKQLKYIVKLVLILLGISGIAYFIGIIFWPFGLEDPIKNPMESLDIMTNFKVSIRQIYEGKFIWSDNVPWYYTLKYILISVPLTILVGMAVTFSILKPLVKNYGWLNIFILVFSFVFPLVYIIYKKSNVYGGWRHMIFAYVIMVIFISIGINHFFIAFKKKYFKYGLLALLLLLHGHSIRHTIMNHPYQYIYFNRIVGGVNGGFGNYETDYYYHSLKESAEWLAENHLDADTAQNVKVVSNHSILTSYYLRNRKNAKVSYVRYYDRGNSDWDYAIIANSYINPKQQQEHIWPPKNTIHTIDVDGVPICAILKRSQKFDYDGYLKLKNKDFGGAINYLNKAIQLESTNEAAYLNLATAYIYTYRFDMAKQTINNLLKVYPEYDKGLNLLGLVYYNEQNYSEANKLFSKVIKINKKFASAYHNKGLALLAMDKKNEALKYFQKAIKTNKKFKPAYLAIAKILRENGKKTLGDKYFEAAKQL